MAQFYFKTLQADGGIKAVEVTKNSEFSPHPDIPDPAGVKNPKVIDVQPAQKMLNRCLTDTEGQPIAAMTRESLVTLLALAYLQGRDDGSATTVSGN